jgi:CubicO group peptidase (beta-lactamase class C family)
MIRKFEGGARHIRASGLRIILFSVVLAGTAPLAAHGQSFEHATKDKVMAALPALETMAQRIVDEDQVPGLSIAVVYRDEVVYLKGFGVRRSTPIPSSSLPRSRSRSLRPWSRPSSAIRR